MSTPTAHSTRHSYGIWTSSVLKRSLSLIELSVGELGCPSSVPYATLECLWAFAHFVGKEPTPLDSKDGTPEVLAC